VPPQDPGNVSLELSLNRAEFLDGMVQLEVVSHVYVTSLSPSSGPVLGGGLVSVLGDGFAGSRIKSCLFGELFSAATLISDSKIQCAAPAVTLCPSEWCAVCFVVVEKGSLLNCNMETKHHRYVYWHTPSISSVYPTLGMIGITHVIHLSGHHFSVTVNMFCKFSGKSDNDVRITIPQTCFHQLLCSALSLLLQLQEL